MSYREFRARPRRSGNQHFKVTETTYSYVFINENRSLIPVNPRE